MIKKFEVNITPFHKSRMIHMYLPDDYDQSDERYPVIYMYDGHNLFFNEDATYGKSWGLKEYLDQCPKKFIVVGMECSHEGNERLNEYCPYDLPNSWLGSITGKGKTYMDWVVDELKPMIDANYRTLSDRNNTMIAGSSMGGLMSYYTVIKYNDVFSRAACCSSAIGMCAKDMRKDILESNILPDTRIYMNWGSEEARDKDALIFYTQLNLEFSNTLVKKGAVTYPHLYRGGHNEASWEKTIPVFMEFLWR